MTRLTWKRAALGAGVLAVLAVGVALSPPSSQAAAAVTCNGTKDHWIHKGVGPPVHVGTTGFLTAGVGSTFVTSDGRQGTNLIVQDVFSTRQAEGIGSRAVR